MEHQHGFRRGETRGDHRDRDPEDKKGKVVDEVEKVT